MLLGKEIMNITSKVVLRKDLYLSECPTDRGQFRLKTVQSSGGGKRSQITIIVKKKTQLHLEKRL